MATWSIAELEALATRALERAGAGTAPSPNSDPLSRPAVSAPETPRGEVRYSRARLRRGASTGSGSDTGVSVSGSSAKESRTETITNGTKPSRSPTSSSHWPSAIATPLTVR